ncbi:MAG: hypothetical protein QHI38_07895 [Armatimonadota bacterium]|nr:hypothetical protein [Armatimonadota bacterium]
MSTLSIVLDRRLWLIGLLCLALAVTLAGTAASYDLTHPQHGIGTGKPFKSPSRDYSRDIGRHTVVTPTQPKTIDRPPIKQLPVTGVSEPVRVYQPSRYTSVHSGPSDARILPVKPPSASRGPVRNSANHDFVEPPKTEITKPTPGVGDNNSPVPPRVSPPTARQDRSREDYGRPDSRFRTEFDKRALEIKKALLVNAGRTVCYEPPIFRDGYYFYKSHSRHTPLRYGYWVFGTYDPELCRRSLYFHYGCLPYIRATRAYVIPYVVVSYVSEPVVCDYYLARREDSLLRDALADIRDGWLHEKSYLITSHLRAGSRIAVFLDNRYEYSVDADDYADMTADAISEIQTISFTWQTLKKREDGSYTAFGRHVYKNDIGETKTIYVMYTLKLIGNDFYITEVGASNAPLG